MPKTKTPTTGTKQLTLPNKVGEDDPTRILRDQLRLIRSRLHSPATTNQPALTLLRLNIENHSIGPYVHRNKDHLRATADSATALRGSNFN